MLAAERRWLAKAEVQAGAISRAQILELGGSHSTVTRRARDGRLRTELPGVYVVAGAPASVEQRRWIALLAAGPGAVLSFETAARIHGVSTVPALGPTVVTVRPSGWQRLPGVTVHQLNDLAPDHVTEVDGLPVTTIERTIVDLAAVWRRGRVRMAVEDAVAAKRTTDAAIGPTPTCSCSPPGASGSTPVTAWCSRTASPASPRRGLRAAPRWASPPA